MRSNSNTINLLAFIPLTLTLFVISLGMDFDQVIFPDLRCHFYYRKGYIEVGNKMCQNGSQLRLNLTKTFPKIADLRSCVLFGLGMIHSKNGTGHYYFNYTKSKSTLRAILGAKHVAGRREKVQMDIFINSLLRRFETCLNPISNLTFKNNHNSTKWGPLLDCAEKATGCTDKKIKKRKGERHQIVTKIIKEKPKGVKKD